MKQKITEVETFTVAGISVRTSNGEESKPASSKLPDLWKRFESQKLAEKISARVPDSLVYGVYSKYESGVSGKYTVTAGVSVVQATDQYDSIEIEAGNYLVFEGTGSMPEIVQKTWADVWSFFEKSKELKRRFGTDFELHEGPDKVSIYIGVA